MATADPAVPSQAPLQSQGSGDNERFYAVALQVAAAEVRQGHEELAQEIRILVEHARKREREERTSIKLVNPSKPRGEVADLLEPVASNLRIRDLVLDPPLRDRIDRILKEQQNLSRLKENNLRPRQRLLFTGPRAAAKR